MNIIFDSLSGLDDELIELAAEGILRRQRRRAALRIVKYTAAAAAAVAACLALPFGIQRFSEWVETVPEPDTIETTGTSAAVIIAAEGQGAMKAPLGDSVNREYSFELPDRPGREFLCEYTHLWETTAGKKKALYDGMPILDLYFADITGDGKLDLCSTASSGSGIISELIQVYDVENSKLYILSDRMVKDYVLTEKDGALYVRIYDYSSYENDNYEEVPLTMSMLTPAESDDQSAELQPGMTDDELRSILAEKGQAALDIYMFTNFYKPVYDGGKEYELIDDSNWVGASYRNIGEGWYFRTYDEMKEFLGGIFTQNIVSEYMEQIFEGQIVDGKIKAEKSAGMISVDGELFILGCIGAGYMMPDLENAWVESVNENEVVFRADVVLDEESGYREAGTYIFRGILRNEGGEWKFASKEPASQMQALPPEELLYNYPESIPEECGITFTMGEFPNCLFNCGNDVVTVEPAAGEKKTAFRCDSIMSLYLADITGDGKREICSVVLNDSFESIYVYSVAADTLYIYVTPYSHVPHYELKIIKNALYFTDSGTAREEKLNMGILTLYTDEKQPRTLYKSGFYLDRLPGELRIYSEVGGEPEPTKYLTDGNKSYVSWNDTLLYKFSKFSDQNEDELGSFAKSIIGIDGLSYSGLHSLPAVNEEFLCENVLSGLRFDNITENMEVCRVNEEWVAIRSYDLMIYRANKERWNEQWNELCADLSIPDEDLIYYRFFVIDNEHGEFLKAAQAFYSEWKGENAAGIRDIEIVRNYSENLGLCAVKLLLSENSDETRIYDIIDKKGLDPRLVFIENTAGVSLDAVGFSDADMSDFQLTANAAALAYLRGDVAKLEALFYDAGYNADFPADSALMDGLDYISVRMPYGIVRSSDSRTDYTVKYRLMPKDGDMCTYLDIGMKKVGSFWRVVSIDLQG